MKLPKVEFEKRTARQWFFGDYDWAYLCKPVWPYKKGAARAPPKFFARDDWLGILTAILMGLQVSFLILLSSSNVRSYPLKHFARDASRCAP